MLDPNQKFIVMTLDRKEIADLLNDVIDEKELDHVPRFDMADDRLTDDLCEQIAGLWAQILDEDLDEEERVAEQRDTLHTLLKTLYKEVIIKRL